MHSRLGAFFSPVHETGQDPHLALKRDMDLVRLLDELNFDEAWFGEHHSLGWGLTGAPETMIAACSQVTKQIRLANGVVPLSGHHPFHVASRAIHLDQLSRGRYMLGVGPGVPFDAGIIGLSPTEQRKRLSEALPDVVELVNGGSRVSSETNWYSLCDAQVQLPRFSPDGIEVAMSTSGTSESTPQMLGKYGLSMLSFALPFTVPRPGANGHIPLARQWELAEEAAAQNGRTISRDNWRIVLPIHVAETRQQALEDVRAGYDRWVYEYFGRIAGRDLVGPETPRGRILEERIESGGALVGSVEDVLAGVSRLQEETGGFGRLVAYVADWTSWEKTDLSMQLLARYISPELTGSAQRPIDAAEHAIVQRQMSAV
ncbi:MAG: LLM class flavin-dependent oxidoreductase [Kocuria rhizophila]|nr:MAG: LLM class flavin-dependent oxidoreductase [Kocuria rhizophila]